MKKQNYLPAYILLFVLLFSTSTVSASVEVTSSTNQTQLGLDWWNILEWVATITGITAWPLLIWLIRSVIKLHREVGNIPQYTQNYFNQKLGDIDPTNIPVHYPSNLPENAIDFLKVRGFYNLQLPYKHLSNKTLDGCVIVCAELQEQEHNGRVHKSADTTRLRNFIEEHIQNDTDAFLSKVGFIVYAPRGYTDWNPPDDIFAHVTYANSVATLAARTFEIAQTLMDPEFDPKAER